jgi:drug/metabolite transporter (DMT)-like permease
MAVVAPLAAVSSAALPVAAGLALGERPPPVAYPGVALALLAVVLVSRGGRPDPAAGGRGRRAALLGLAAGAGFGGYFVLLARCGPAGGVWPLLVSRGSASVLVVVLAVATGTVARPVAGVVRLALLAGSLDTTANLLYLLAVQRGLLALVAVLVALYPATTVTLATLVLGERTGRTQRIGLAVAAASVALIAVA